MNTEKIIEEEKKIEKIIEKELKGNIFTKAWVKSVFGIIVILLILLGFTLWRFTAGQIKIDNSSIQAPIINLSSSTPGILQEIFVKVGDTVGPNTPIAKVGDETVLSRVGGIIVSVNHQEGQFFNAGVPVVSMLNKEEERVVGKIDENKGFSEIKVGQKATFTVDAFGSERFEGVVDEVSPTSDDTGIVFNISDKRAVKQFDIKVRFDAENYSKLKNGMSARITVFVD